MARKYPVHRFEERHIVGALHIGGIRAEPRRFGEDIMLIQTLFQQPASTTFSSPDPDDTHLLLQVYEGIRPIGSSYTPQ